LVLSKSNIFLLSAKRKWSPRSLAKISEGDFRDIQAHRDEADDGYFLLTNCVAILLFYFRSKGIETQFGSKKYD
jgi:hypothetical protein